MALSDVRGWSSSKQMRRLRAVANALRASSGEKGDSIDRLLDEAVIILLEVLRVVIDENKWECSSLELFEGVYKEDNVVAKMVRERFSDTRKLVDRYKAGSKVEKAELKPILSQRGML